MVTPHLDFALSSPQSVLGVGGGATRLLTIGSFLSSWLRVLLFNVLPPKRTRPGGMCQSEGTMLVR